MELFHNLLRILINNLIIQVPAEQSGIAFEHYNEYDWNYVMNMMYSDFYGAISNDTSAYVKLAKKWLEDKDAVDGKALCYYLHIVKRK